MEKNVVFLVYWPITSREIERYGFDTIKAHGFNVKVCDVTKLCNRLALERNPVGNALIDSYISVVDSFDELETFMRNTATNSIYIDYIRGLNDLDTSIEKVFRLLKKHRIKYFTILNGTLPTPELDMPSRNRPRHIFFRLRKVFHPKILYRYIIKQAIVYLRRKRVLFSLPSRVFVTDAPLIIQRFKKYNLNYSIAVKVHSDDYYDFLKRGSHLNDISHDIQKPYCVFIDEGIIGNPDIDSCGLKNFNAKSYASEIEKVLCYFEDNYKLTAIVAAHPRVDMEVLKTIYPGRIIVQGKTQQLIGGSDFVIGHHSTALGFAALLKKPIIIVETSEIRNDEAYHSIVHAMANALGVVPFQTDLDELSKLAEYKNCSMDKYDQYVNRYIKTSGASNEDLWLTVMREVTRELG